MTRSVFVLALVAGCGKGPPPAVETSPPVAAAAADAAPVTEAVEVEIARAPLTGNLAGKPFTPRKALLRTRPEGSTLDLYDWTEGDPCSAQLAPEPSQLYIEVTFARAAVGPVEDVRAIYQRGEKRPIRESVKLELDELGEIAKGRLLLTAPDGTHVEGAFEATVCAGAQRELAAPAPIHGLAWGTRGVVAAKLPKEPVRGVLLGTAGAPVAVEVIDWKDGPTEQHEIHFYFETPGVPCQFSQVSPGFNVAFGATLKRGLAIDAESTLVVHGLKPFGVAVWKERGNSIGMAGDGWVSAIIDKHTRDAVQGRVFAWFNDPSKSMLAGAFVARNCNAKP